MLHYYECILQHLGRVQYFFCLLSQRIKNPLLDGAGFLYTIRGSGGWLGASFDVGIAAVNCAELDAGYGKFGIFAV